VRQARVQAEDGQPDDDLRDELTERPQPRRRDPRLTQRQLHRRLDSGREDLPRRDQDLRAVHAQSEQFSYDVIFPWIDGQLFAAAAKAGNLDASSKPADVIAALDSIQNETLDGLAPPLSFAKGQPHFVGCYFETQLKSGKLVSTKTEPTCPLCRADQGPDGARLRPGE
jgi:hypothetical protein